MHRSAALIASGGGRQRLASNRHGNLAAHDLKQSCTLPAGVSLTSSPMQPAKGPARTRAASPGRNASPNDTASLPSRRARRASTTPLGTGCGRSPAMINLRHAERAVDAAPAIATERQMHKQVSRKQRRLRRPEGAGVPGGLPVGREEGLEPLRRKLALGAELPVWLGLGHVPPRRATGSLRPSTPNNSADTTQPPQLQPKAFRHC